MSIRIPQPPQGSAVEASRSVSRLAHSEAGGGRLSALVGAGGVQPDVPLQYPHRVFTVGLRELAAKRPLRDARESSWRYLVPDAGRVLSAEVRELGGGGHKFARLNEGPFGPATKQAIDRVLTSADFEGREYDLATLAVPALSLFALWLRAEQSADDLFIGIAPTPPAVRPNETYRADQFLEILSTAAQRRLDLQRNDPEL